MHKHKEFQQKPPMQTPPRQGAPDPPKFFMHGASLPFKMQEKPMHKEFQGGGLRVPKIVYALIVCAFYLLLNNKAGRFGFSKSAIRIQYEKNAENAEGPSPQDKKNKGLRRFHRAKTRKMRTRKRGKCGKCG